MTDTPTKEGLIQVTGAVGHGERSHALCSASSAHRWLNCPGSIRLLKITPRRPSGPYAEEGTRAHELAEGRLNQWLSNEMFTADTDNDEMGEHVQNYVDFVKTTAGEFDSKPAIRLESKLTLHRDLNMWGTADVAMSGEREGDAHGKIIDLKYGKTKVAAENNPQLAYYAAALVMTSNRIIKSVEVIIHQPRAKDPVTRIEYTRDELIEWFGVLTMGCERAMHQMMHLQVPQYIEGVWCKYCDASSICPAKNTFHPDAGKEFEKI